MKLKHIITLTLLAGILSACESREDWYERINPAAEISLKEIGGEGVANDTINISMRFGEKKKVEYVVSDNFSLEKNYTFYFNDVDNEPFKLYQDFSAGEICIESLTDAKAQENKNYTYKVIMYVKDYYEKVSYAYINLTIQPNQPPVPELKYSELSGSGVNPKYEYEFSAEGSSDPDGDDIVAYEYLFDGTPRKSSDKFIYETDKNGKEITNHMPGNAAYGGTYIYATKLSAVKHAFQSSGSHTAYVRCKDSWGCWSSWKEVKLVIKE